MKGCILHLKYVNGVGFSIIYVNAKNAQLFQAQTKMEYSIVNSYRFLYIWNLHYVFEQSSSQRPNPNKNRLGSS